ncbi:hypothetical protein R3P38DRAFT_3230331 [Favolaschia claudopus]|uniref:F-box domain-containing protein n=1 Tax=Favolaschia claudopus TaxID=2862362 RepID=A0AAV9ZNG7_9AGAR
MPINDLPVELLEKIFLLVPDPPDRYPERWNKSRAMLSLICRVWEGIIWHCPAFSAVICVDIRVDLSLLARRLTFAGACPLALSFVFPSSGIWLCQPFPRLMELVFEMLAPHLDRCGSISLLLRIDMQGGSSSTASPDSLHGACTVFAYSLGGEYMVWTNSTILRIGRKLLFDRYLRIPCQFHQAVVVGSLQILCLEDMHDYDGLPLGDFLSALRVMSVLRDLRLVNLLFSDLDTYAGPVHSRSLLAQARFPL